MANKIKSPCFDRPIATRNLICQINRIEIPIPFIDNPHVKFEIPLKRWLSHINDAVEPVVDHVLTDGVFSGILDGACSLADGVPKETGE